MFRVGPTALKGAAHVHYPDFYAEVIEVTGKRMTVIDSKLVFPGHLCALQALAGRTVGAEAGITRPISQPPLGAGQTALEVGNLVGFTGSGLEEPAHLNPNRSSTSGGSIPRAMS